MNTIIVTILYVVLSLPSFIAGYLWWFIAKAFVAGGKHAETDSEHADEVPYA